MILARSPQNSNISSSHTGMLPEFGSCQTQQGHPLRSPSPNSVSILSLPLVGFTLRLRDAGPCWTTLRPYRFMRLRLGLAQT